jgi:acyl-coenzyme A thioesterase PaaI-like protein
VALVNLAELAANLAMIAGLPENSRMIVKSISIEYLKKARGTLTAIGSCEVLSSNAPRDVEPEVQIENAAGEVVARAKLKCLIGPNH